MNAHEIQAVNPLKPKSHYSGSDNCKQIFFKNVLWSHPLKLLYSRMNGLLLRGFWQITHYTYAYNIISYLNAFYYPKCFPLQVFWNDIEGIRLVHNTLANILQRNIRNKSLYCEKSPFSAEQNGEIRFCIECFIYKILGIKHMHVQKPL